MDVECCVWLDLIHAGLQSQAVHHLFSRIPGYNLRKAEESVWEFCKNTGLKYTIFGFREGNEIVLGA